MQATVYSANATLTSSSQIVTQTWDHVSCELTDFKMSSFGSLMTDVYINCNCVSVNVNGPPCFLCVC